MWTKTERQRQQGGESDCQMLRLWDTLPTPHGFPHTSGQN